MEPEEIGQDDWQQPLVRYLSDPSKETRRSVKQQALNYALIDGIFFRRGKDRGWLRPGGVYHFDSPLSLGLA